MDSDENNFDEEQISIEELIEEFLDTEAETIYNIYTKLNYDFPWLFEKQRSSAELLFFISDLIHQPQNIKQIPNTISFQKFFNEYNDDIYDTLYVINKYFEFNQNKNLRQYRINIKLWVQFLFRKSVQ